MSLLRLSSVELQKTSLSGGVVVELPPILAELP